MCPLGGHVSAFIYQFRFQRLNTASGIFPSPPRSRGGLFQILLESRQNFTGSLLVIKKIKMAAPQPYLPRTVALLVISGRTRTGRTSWMKLAYGSPPQCRSNSRTGFVLFSVMAQKIGGTRPGRTREEVWVWGHLPT